MSKKFVRSGGYIGGVCEGLGDYTGVDPIIWRILALFVVPGAFWIYLLLWIFTKKED